MGLHSEAPTPEFTGFEYGTSTSSGRPACGCGAMAGASVVADLGTGQGRRLLLSVCSDELHGPCQARWRDLRQAGLMEGEPAPPD